MTSQLFKYDIALSFAGEDRALANFLANSLRESHLVFYDEFEKEELWGSDLSELLPEKYISAKYCVILQSDDYLVKMWTVLERQALISEFLKRRGKNYVLPIRVRGCTSQIPGLSDLTGYITVRSEADWDHALSLLRQKLA
jgi:hypothetical protein